MHIRIVLDCLQHLRHQDDGGDFTTVAARFAARGDQHVYARFSMFDCMAAGTGQRTDQHAARMRFFDYLRRRHAESIDEHLDWMAEGDF